MTDAKTKAIFGGLTPDDAEILAKQIFMGEFDIDEVKKEIYTRKVVDYRLRWFRSESETKGSSDTIMDSNSQGEAQSSGTGAAQMESTLKNQPFFSDDGALSYTTSEFVGSIKSSAKGGGYALTDSQSTTKGISEGLEPIMGTELSGTHFRPLDEQLYRAMALMANQPQAHYLIKMPLKTVKALKVPRVEEGFADIKPEKNLLKRYEEKNFNKYKSEFIALKEQVDKEINSRQVSLLKTAEEETKKEKKDKEGSIEDLRE